MSDYAIQVTSLDRDHNKQRILDKLNMAVPRGSIYGLLGRNGAGKTTLMKTLCGLLHPHGGEVLVNGLNPWNMDSVARQNVGYVSEKQILPPQKRINYLINFCSQLYTHWDVSLCDGLLSRFQIDRSKRLHTLSMGNQRLVAFILAIAPRPDLLLLDEPAANLDVIARRELLNEILSLARETGKTVIFSSHILTDVERVADEVGILTHGKVAVSSPLDDLKESIKEVRLFDFPSTPPDSIVGVLSYKRDKHEALAVMNVASPDAIEELELKFQCRTEVRDLPLEDLFIYLTNQRPETI